MQAYQMYTSNNGWRSSYPQVPQIAKFQIASSGPRCNSWKASLAIQFNHHLVSEYQNQSPQGADLEKSIKPIPLLQKIASGFVSFHNESGIHQSVNSRNYRGEQRIIMSV